MLALCSCAPAVEGMSPAPSIPPSGNPLIDQQHSRLNQLIHHAALAARDTESAAPFERALIEFRRALAHHFSVEKVIFSGAGFDAASGHDRAHAIILQRLDSDLAAVKDLSTVQARHRVLEELEQILLDHEMLEDAAYWDAVRAHSASPTLKWSDLMVIGIDWVDDHHRHMVDLLNQMSQAGQMSRVGDHAAGPALLEQFLQLTRDHFAAEERYLEALGKPLPRHRADHARMLADLDGLTAAEGLGLRALVDHYLRFWVIEHILGIDRQDLGT